jgi:hypothetical protein
MAAAGQFSPAARERILKRTARDLRFRELAGELMDIGKGAPRSADSVDAAIDEALATTSERAELRAATAERDPRAMQRAQARLAERKRELRGEPGAGQPQRPTVREWLERMSPEERAAVEQSARFEGLSAQAQALVLRVRDDVDAIDEQADLLLAQQREDEWLSEDEEPGEPAAEEDLDFAAWAPPMGAEEALGLYDQDDEVVELEPGWEYADDEVEVEVEDTAA